MLSKKSTVQFNGTKEQEKELLEVIHELKDEKGSLMPILQRAQDIYGYLPIEVQKIILMKPEFHWKRSMELSPFIPSLT